MREEVSRGLVAEGREDKASLAAQPEMTMVEELPGSPADGWRLLRFDAVPHASASFCVAYGPERQVFYLTERPDRFAAFTRAAGVRVTGPAEAVALARTYLATTRSMNAYAQVVTSVDELDVLGYLDEEDQRRLDAARERLRPVLSDPFAVVSADGFEVTFYIQRGSIVERRTLAVAADGAVTGRAEELVDDLPAPISL
ncbi:MAG: hypothetical protein GEV11_23650 [Streptosporangiales bacterium]|nr:hypothetical protein [Streptosporangiales bacterium]